MWNRVAVKGTVIGVLLVLLVTAALFTPKKTKPFGRVYLSATQPLYDSLTEVFNRDYPSVTLVNQISGQIDCAILIDGKTDPRFFVRANIPTLAFGQFAQNILEFSGGKLKLLRTKEQSSKADWEERGLFFVKANSSLYTYTGCPQVYIKNRPSKAIEQMPAGYAIAGFDGIANYVAAYNETNLCLLFDFPGVSSKLVTGCPLIEGFLLANLQQAHQTVNR